MESPQESQDRGASAAPGAAEAAGGFDGVELEELGVRFGGEAVLADVDLRLPAGRTALLRGPNGAGKSTLLRAVVGLLPFDGEVKLFGHRPKTLEARATFAFVADVPALFEDLTVDEHAAFVSRAYDRPETEARVHAWLERFELDGRGDEYPGTHSRGMRHKLALSLALGLEPRLLVLDEPFNTLDADARDTLSDGLRARAEAGGINLLSAHDRALEEELDAWVVEVRGGQVRPLKREGAARGRGRG